MVPPRRGHYRHHRPFLVTDTCDYPMIVGRTPPLGRKSHNPSTSTRDRPQLWVLGGEHVADFALFPAINVAGKDESEIDLPSNVSAHVSRGGLDLVTSYRISGEPPQPLPGRSCLNGSTLRLEP